MEEDSRDAELLPGYQWLLQDLPKLPLFDSVRSMTASALQQVSYTDLFLRHHFQILLLLKLLSGLTKIVQLQDYHYYSYLTNHSDTIWSVTPDAFNS